MLTWLMSIQIGTNVYAYFKNLSNYVTSKLRKLHVNIIAEAANGVILTVVCLKFVY